MQKPNDMIVHRGWVRAKYWLEMEQFEFEAPANATPEELEQAAREAALEVADVNFSFSVPGVD